ncbi:MAG: leucine-rich repeat domain-containing protein [Bacteroidales bacterium]|nr:leucine-rich repeat domain-containing protein [Bacteroidales bacterium]
MKRLIVLLSVFFTWNAFAQELNRGEVANFKTEGQDLISYLEFTLNAIGDNELSPKEKDIIISESFLKIFRDVKVQVEDDLDDSRETVTNKDVQAYLKDVDFFFKYAHFTFNVLSIDLQIDEQGNPFLLCNILRTLKAIDLNGDTLSNDQQRFIEIELNGDKREMKIASIYTTKLNENEENIRWWNLLPDSWKIVLGTRAVVSDSLAFSSILLLNEEFFILKPQKTKLTDFENYPMDFLHLGNDSIGYYSTFQYDTIWLNDSSAFAQKESVFKALNEILEIKDLNIAGNLNITDIEPLSRLSNLRTLNVSHTNIESIAPVRSLTRLLNLDCSHTAINSIEALNYSASLNTLDISNTSIYNIKPLENLENLLFLDISNTRIDNLDALKAMKLIDLKMRNTFTTDLAPLEALTSLKYLYIDDNEQLDSIGALSHLVKLKSLSCNNTRINDLSALATLPNLETISCENTEITSLSGLESLPKLTKIYCDNSLLGKQKAIDFMKVHPHILVVYESKQLQLWWNELPQAWKNVFAELVELDTYTPSKEQLHEITTLKEINVAGRPLIKSLISLNKLKNLQKLYADETSITNLDGISEAREMRSLNISNTKIHQLNSIEGLNLIEELSIANCPVKDLNPLRGMVNLKNLIIENTLVDDLSPLDDLQNLRYLYADNIKVDQQQFEDFIEYNNDIDLVFQTDILYNWWNDLVPSWKKIFEDRMQWTQEPQTEDLHKLIKIHSLEINENRSISDLKPLNKIKHLRTLKVNDTKISDVSPLNSLTYLKEINLSRNPITNLDSLQNLTNLEVLYLNNTLISDLEWLVTLPQIKLLDISSTGIKKLKELYNVIHLKVLIAYNTKISNIKPLEDLPDLVLLKIYNSNVSQKKVKAFKKKNPNCEVDFY